MFKLSFFLTRTIITKALGFKSTRCIYNIKKKGEGEEWNKVKFLKSKFFKEFEAREISLIIILGLLFILNKSNESLKNIIIKKKRREREKQKLERTLFIFIF